MTRQAPPDVVAAAQAAQAKWSVPASVSIGQWALESAWGAKTTAPFNYFGIKARPGEPYQVVTTHEVIHGQSTIVNAAFRAFTSMAQAFDRHAELLATSPYYAGAMALLPAEDAFVAAMAHHYATDPNYAASLLAVINDDGLRRFDTPSPSTTDTGHDATLAAISGQGAG